MSTSDPTPPVPGAGGAPNDAFALSLATEIERLANTYFAGVPGPALNAPAVVSPSPPVGAPVPMALPNRGPSALAASPIPDEASLRTIPALFADSLGTTPLALAQGPDAFGAPHASSDAPYFLAVAGPPIAAPTQTSAPTPAPVPT